MKENGVTTQTLKEILRCWKQGMPLPDELHPSVFRPPPKKEWPFWHQKFGRMSFLRGLYHEELLKYLLEQASQDPQVDWLLGVVRVPALGVRDRAGIDLTIQTLFGKLHVQVKSSKLGREIFIEKGKEKGCKPMPCVVVNTEMTDREILRGFVEEVGPHLRVKLRQKQAWDDAQQTHAP